MYNSLVRKGFYSGALFFLCALALNFTSVAEAQRKIRSSNIPNLVYEADFTQPGPTKCFAIDLKKHCADGDGCTLRFIYKNDITPSEKGQLYNYGEHYFHFGTPAENGVPLVIENPLPWVMDSLNTDPAFGRTDIHWVVEDSQRFVIGGPNKTKFLYWLPNRAPGLGTISNYFHNQCEGQNGRDGEAFTGGEQFKVVIGYAMGLKFIVKD